MMGLVLRGLRYYWRGNLGVLGGVALASAVLTGALLVGDSIDYSLRTFAMLRLGGIHYALDTRSQFVQQPLAARLAQAANAKAAPALRLPAMAIFQPDDARDRAQVNKVDVIGVEDAFWSFGAGDAVELGPREAAINVKLALALGVGEGDEISLRVAKPSLMPRDSPLSWRDEDLSRRSRYTVKHVLKDETMGRFGLSPSQSAPFNAFVNLAFLQDEVELADRANLLLLGEGLDPDGLERTLNDTWRIEDIGLSLRAHPSGVVQLESDRIFLPAEAAEAALALPGAQGTLTYLATSLAMGEKLTPYFFAVAGPVPEGLRDDEMVINRWMADQLGAGVGDRVTLTYAELLPSNTFQDRTRDFTVHSVREMDDLITEKELMPVFPGMSDVESCSDWDVGMPMDEELLNDEANEAYWDTYRATPKVFVTLAAGREMWGNRFGNLTAVRIPGDAGGAAVFEAQIRGAMDPAKAGLYFTPVHEQSLAAVSGAMDFGGLFLGMSFFLIVAALMLTGLLFVFGAQQRAAQMGTLLAVGFPARTVRRILLGEGLLVAVFGAVLGAGLGTLYTRLLILGLSRYWQGAIAQATILYHAEPLTAVIGVIATVICAFLAMFIAIRGLSREPARNLLTMDFAQHQPVGARARAGKWRLLLPAVGCGLALLMVLASLVTGDATAAPVFFGAGALLLMSGIALFRGVLGALQAGTPAESLTLFRLAVLNLGRRPARSTAVVGLLGCGCFLVFAVSSMQEDLAAHAHDRASGTGGFTLIADSTFPLLEDPVKSLADAEVSALAIKVRDGDDASCLNLNQAQTPGILGVDVDGLASREAFASSGAADSPWRLLDMDLPGGEIPALVGDTNTAMWTLKKKTGVEKGDVLIYRDESGNEVPVKLVGSLPLRLSVFQGSLLISQQAFTRIYPSEDGHRMFLIDAPQARSAALAAELGRKFERFGLDAIPAVARLEEFYSVESTYLAMFLVLGGLGLAIGGLGMAVVVLRNLFERRAEIATLGALGFTRKAVHRTLFIEYGVLLLAGLGIGAVAAALAMLPALYAARPSGSAGTQLGIAIVVFASYAACMFLAVRIGVRRVAYAAIRQE